MDKNIQKKVIDIAGIELTPGEPTVCLGNGEPTVCLGNGEPTVCLGNGEQGFECCCDECDYYLLCFLEFDLKNEEEIRDIELPPPSKRHRIRMNRLFRERVGGAFLPFPEVDNFYERALSKLRVKLKINEFLDRRKETQEIK